MQMGFSKAVGVTVHSHPSVYDFLTEKLYFKPCSAALAQVVYLNPKILSTTPRYLRKVLAWFKRIGVREREHVQNVLTHTPSLATADLWQPRIAARVQFFRAELHFEPSSMKPVYLGRYLMRSVHSTAGPRLAFLKQQGSTDTDNMQVIYKIALSDALFCAKVAKCDIQAYLDFKQTWQETCGRRWKDC